MEGILSLIKQGHMLQSPWRTQKLPQKNTTKALKYNEDEPTYSMLTVDALDHTRSVSFSFCLYVGDIFVLICGARCSYAGKVKYPEMGQCLFLSVLFSYFGDSTVVHQIGTQSTVGSLPEAHCIFFFFVKVDQDLSYQCLHACLELVDRARHSTFMFFAIVMELSNGLMKI